MPPTDIGTSPASIRLRPVQEQLRCSQESTQALRVLLGLLPAAKQDLRSMLFTLEEGKAVDLGGLQAS